MSIFHTVGFWIKPASGVVYEPDFQTYLDSLVTPLSDGQKTLMNNFYVTVKTGLDINLLSNTLDGMYFLANETAESGLKNIVKRDYDATAVASPIFTALEGFDAESTLSYLTIPFNPSVAGVKCVYNDNCMMTYHRILNDTSANHLTWGGTNGIRMRYVAPGFRYYNYNFNSSLGIYITEDITRPVGFMHSRRLLTNMKAGHNKAYKTFSTAPSVFNSTISLFVNSKQTSMYMIAQNMSDEHLYLIQDAFETYMDGNGKGVL